MVDLSSLSRLGFGAYRISADSAAHRQALAHALRSGCNVIDTSANYMNGGSEILIGKVIADHPTFDTFIITKAGYIQGNNLAIIDELNQRGLAQDELLIFSEDYKYSIQPDFLRCQVELSCKRLGRKQIDGFLLHNPEHHLKQKNGDATQDEFYAKVRKAFECLEELVSAGTIRYYGISSNTFPLSTDAPTTTDLHRVLAAAESVSGTHHFKLIQFPFNLFEKDALQPHHGGVSLIELARMKGLVTFCNRPLNANTAAGPFRIATYDEAIRDLDETEEGKIFAKCLDLIHRQLRRVGLAEEPMDFPVLQFLRDSRTEIVDSELVTQIFQERFYPFLNKLYEGSIPQEEIGIYWKLQQNVMLYSRRAITRQVLALRRRMIDQGEVLKDDPRPMATIACDQYLKSGIDHVLVGMRRMEYVDTLKELFCRRQAR